MKLTLLFPNEFLSDPSVPLGPPGSFWHTDPDFEPLWGYGPYEQLIAPNQ